MLPKRDARKDVSGEGYRMMWRWLDFAIGFIILTIIGAYSRRFVRKNAPSYEASNILIVGAVFGFVIGLVVLFVTQTGPTIATVLLFIWGFLAAAYLGFEPDAIDRAKKTQQVGVVAATTYVLVVSVIYWLLLM